MTAPFRLFGAELSPYSIKVRSYLRYKGVEFEWLTRTNARQEEFARYAKLPLIPVLVDANENALQDSTPMIEALEAEFPDRSITPDEAALAFVSALLEDYADEWLNKAMFHYRWSYPEDQESAAQRIAGAIFEGGEKPEGIEESVRTRMVSRLYHVGSSPETAALIEGSFARALELVEAMLKGRPYLFGGRPSLADFGLAAQFAQLLSDPTPGAIIRAQAPNVVAWIARMDSPTAEGAFARLDDVRAPLADLLRMEVAGAYLAWMSANAAAVEEDANGVAAEIGGVMFTQKPQRYAAKAFAELQRKRAAVKDAALAALLQETGCDAYLSAADEEEEGEAEAPARSEDADEGANHSEDHEPSK
ncbi:MAG TPA: glutathione S-transferase family protein [Vitreimonas sp.]|uniref:glutathione S-transferase family protein n=1 Tax=Vitreimonas sp. TaxID=3069702 RepID=UPI002D38AC55|nr:glutathione S-transferase family protein [Vitreimonas sp.]HYD87594.1 glutathione S-transferase family protein [Vitreimonas sp.]